MLAASPATARHLAFELAQYFVADEPPPALRRPARRSSSARPTATSPRSGIEDAPHQQRRFRDSVGQKYKTPYQYVLSAARAAGVEVNNPRPLLGTMFRLGVGVYQCQTPDGYKNTEDAWLSPDATTLRIGFATGLGRGALPLKSPPPEQVAANAMATPQLVSDPAVPAAKPEPPKGDPLDPAPLVQLLGPSLSDQTVATVEQAPPGLQAALILGSPDFMRR